MKRSVDNPARLSAELKCRGPPLILQSIHSDQQRSDIYVPLTWIFLSTFHWRAGAHVRVLFFFQTKLH